MSNLKDIIEQSFTQYSGAVLQSRALVDVRDGLKPSARQIFYSMYTHKLTNNKPHKKTMNAVGLAMADYYIHGDSSCEGVIMRAGQDFAMRYPLVDVKGNAGTLISSGSWAAPRYTESRLSKTSDILFKDIDKEVINEWRDNYDNTKQYPAVFPSKGFYNLVNGGLGIGIGMSFSCPQFSLKEMNNALIHLLWNPECSFDDIYCPPDFATGAILLNEEEVKQSLRDGNGKACKLRSVIEYDSKERCLVVTEIPYGVYTNTICGELEKVIEAEENPGIDRFNDLTGKTPLIKIYLTKTANPDKVIKYLYKNTSLQSFYGINLTMLENGRFPKVFTWKEALQAHLDHEIEVYIRGYQYDLNKIKERLHIIDGLLIALASIDEVVHAIKSSTSTAAAQQKLIENFLLDEAQAKAILDMKLARLAHLEVEKLEKEKSDKETEARRIEEILNNKELLYKEIEKGLKEVAEKFGDARRTKVLNVEKENEETVEIKQLVLNISNNGYLYANETSSLYTQKRGGVGSKFKLEKNDFIRTTATGNTNDTMLFFTDRGNFYHIKASEIPLEEKVYIGTLMDIPESEKICKGILVNKENLNKNLLIITKQGLIKKSLMSEYNIKRRGGARAIELSKDDRIISVLVADSEKIGIASEQGNLMICETKDIRAISRISKGVKGIKLSEGDSAVAAHIVKDNVKEIITISKQGYIKKTAFTEFGITGRYTKGAKAQLLKDDDTIIDFLPINDAKEVIVVSKLTQIKIDINTIQTSGKSTQGAQAIKLTDKNHIVGIVS